MNEQLYRCEGCNTPHTKGELEYGYCNARLVRSSNFGRFKCEVRFSEITPTPAKRRCGNHPGLQYKPPCLHAQADLVGKALLATNPGPAS